MSPTYPTSAPTLTVSFRWIAIHIQDPCHIALAPALPRLLDPPPERRGRRAPAPQRVLRSREAGQDRAGRARTRGGLRRGWGERAAERWAHAGSGCSGACDGIRVVVGTDIRWCAGAYPPTLVRWVTHGYVVDAEATKAELGLGNHPPLPLSTNAEHEWDNYTTLASPPPAKANAGAWTSSLYRGIVPAKRVLARDLAVNGAIVRLPIPSPAS